MTMQTLSGSATYGTLMARRLLWLGLSLATVLAVALADILTGPAFLNVADVVRALFNPAGAEP